MVISLAVTYVICVSCVRLWIRKGSYGSDDAVIAVATVMSFAHTAVDYLALANGLGSPNDRIEDALNLPTLNAASLAGVVLFTVSLYLTKCATLTFVSRITKAKSQIVLYHSVNGLVATIGLVSVLIVSVACPPETYYWNFHDNRVVLSCPSQSARWQAFTGLDIVTEIILLVLPIQLVWSLHMALMKKAMIVTAFSLRLPVIGLSIARNYFTLQLRLPGTDIGLTSGLVVIFLECQLAYALASSTLSASKAFTESFSSGFGLRFTRSAGEDSYGLSGVSGSGKSGKSKDEKSRGDSTIDSKTTPILRAPPRPQRPSADRIDTFLAELPPSESPLKLRPANEGNTITSVSARPALHGVGEHEPSSTESASSSNYSSNNDDTDIHAQTSVEVHCDDAPILQRVPGAYA